MSLTLPGPPVRLGISWRSDAAEPGCVIINRVTPGSPADVAGLHVNDRIHEINGQSFSSSEQFRQLALQASSPIGLEVESLGRIRRVEIPVLTRGAAEAKEPTESEDPAGS